ncbi:MAG: DUF3098 domain-containing protein [Muribaculaceae bacterium]|nr:DUF3098 domain-containing protein [Muribaculaceae bacterium]
MKKEKENLRRESSTDKPLGRKNFIAMGIAGAMIVLGFLLMLGSANGTDGNFNPDIFSTRRIVVGPFIAFLGFVGMAIAIICPFGRKTNIPAEK